MSPNIAWPNPQNIELLKYNSTCSNYAKEFKIGFREKFKKNEIVFIEETELKKQVKLNDRFKSVGTIKEVLSNYSYLVKCEDKIKKGTLTANKILNLYGKL